MENQHIKELEATLLLISGASEADLMVKYGLGPQIYKARQIKAILEGKARAIHN